MNRDKQKIVIIGEGETGEIAYEYFTYDSNYEVIAFSAERNFINNKVLHGLPVVPFEEIEKLYDPKKFKAFVAVSFTQLNSVRTRLFNQTILKGFSLVTYVSSRAFFWKNAVVGSNCFIFENNIIQNKVKIDNNVTIWSGSFIGHQSIIKNNCFISAHAAIGGFCEIGENCFVGLNSSIANNVKIAKDCVVGAGSVIIRDTEEGKVYIGNPAKPMRDKTSFDVFKL